ncbi:MAG TPA: hypothetical protein VGG33_29415, partial [Polyangia bacterium]
MPAIRIHVSWADGRTKEERFEGDSIVIGSGAEAHFQITNAPEVAAAHLLVIPRGKGAWVSGARDAKVPVMYAGKVFENGLLPLGSELDIGSITLKILAPDVQAKSSTRTIAIAAVAMVGIYLVFPKSGSAMPQSDAPAPVLFSKPQTACPEPQRAAPRAQEAIAAADSREIRYGFDRAEGVAAVAQLGVAEMCATVGRNTRLAAEIRERRVGLETRINADYKGLQIELGRAMPREDYVTIVQCAHQLRRLTAHQPGPYTVWLAELHRNALEKVKAAEEAA